MTDPVPVVRIITRLNVGGPTRHVRLLMGGLDPARWRQTLLAGEVEEGESEAPFAASLPRVLIPALVRPIRPRRDLAAYRRLLVELRRVAPMIVHTHQGKAGLLGRLAANRARVPITVHTYHGHTFATYWGPTTGRLLLGAERWAARRSTALIAQSRSQARDVVHYLGRELETRVRIVPPGIDFDELDRVAGSVSRLRADLGLAGHRVVAFVARLAPVKNCAGFLRVMRRLLDQSSASRIAAVIVGGGSPVDEERLQDQADSLGLRPHVRWVGQRDDVATIYDLADVVVLTSHMEGTPLVLIEALARGAAVASYGVGGVEDLVGEFSRARVVRPGDEEGLARAIRELLEVPSEAEVRAVAADVRDRYAAARLLTGITALYEELLSRRRAGGP